MWHTWMTPFFFLSVPFSAVVLVTAVISVTHEDVPVFYTPSLIVWMIGLLLFQIPSVLFSVLYNQSTRRSKSILLYNYKKDDFYNFFRNLSLLIIIVDLIRLRSSMSLSGLSFGSDELSEEYATTGLVAHINQILLVLFPYMVYKVDKQHKSAFVILLLIVICLFAEGVKSWIILPLFAGGFLRIITKKTKLSLKVFVIPVIGAVFVFFMSYFLLMIASEKAEFSIEWLLFMYHHILCYLSGGLLTFGIDFQKGILEPINIEALFGPIVNIYSILLGDGKFVDVINPVFIPIGVLDESNVRTFFGTIFCYSHDKVVFGLVSMYISLIIYFCYYISKTITNIFTIVASCFNLSFLTFGFFEYYWLNLPCYELPLLSLLIGVCFEKFNKNNNYAQTCRI